MKDICKYLPQRISSFIINYPDKSDITEIRLRKNCNMQFIQGGRITATDIYVSQKEIEDILYLFCQRSINAFEEEISNGFITLPQGHRIGIGGQYYYSGSAGRYLLKELKSLNIRVAKEDVYFFNQEQLFNQHADSTLIIGPPHSGKTSFIRIYANMLAKDYRTVICDERSELYSASLNCDVIQGVKKPQAVSMATRTLNPQFIVCDEIGQKEEAEEILSAVNTGVKFICTAHGESFAQVMKRPNIRLLADSGIFSKVVTLASINNRFVLEDITYV